MSTALAISQPPSLSLYEVEQELLALLDTEDLVRPEQREEFERTLAAALAASVEKRERVGQFLRFCELQQENCDAEIQRLQRRKHQFSIAEERTRACVQNVLESLGVDDKGKPRRLEGKTVTFSLRAKPASVDVTDEAAVPSRYKRAAVCVYLETWEELKQLLARSEDPD